MQNKKTGALLRAAAVGGAIAMVLPDSIRQLEILVRVWAFCFSLPTT